MEKYSQPGATFLPTSLKEPPFSIAVPGESARPGETAPRRHPAAKDNLATHPGPDLNTLYDVLQYSTAQWGNRRCVGTRPLLDTHHETKLVSKMVDGRQVETEKKWTYFELGPYQYLSFVEYHQLVSHLGAGLRQLGLGRDDKIHLYGSTSMPWMALAHGAFSQSITIVTAYDTLGLDGLVSSLKQTESVAIFVDPSLMSRLVQALDSSTTIKHVIINDTVAASEQNQIDALKSKLPALNVVTYSQVLSTGTANPISPVPPSPSSLACIMYTSGTSSTPKGVSLTHANLTATIAGAGAIVQAYIHPGDRLLAYLPQAHIIEFVIENMFMYWGATLGYGSPKTLTEASMRNCQGDMREFRPTILAGVPVVWETIVKGIRQKVEGSGGLKRSIFEWGLALRRFLVQHGLPGTSIVDAIVMRQVREATGGALRVCLSGGGPLSADTQEYVSHVIAPLIQGYGLTETCGMGVLNDPLSWTTSAIGEIVPSVEIKLVDFADAGYFAASNPPQGEIWIRGGSVTGSYYKNEEETKAAFDKDGWFMTGDIGEFTSEGQLKVIDRKKNLVKNLKGEYIALEKLETAYRTSPIVANVCIYAAEDREKPMAIVVLAEAAALRLAEASGVEGIEGKNLETLVENKKFQKSLTTELQKTGRTSGLAELEIIDRVVIDTEPWTPDNGLTTPTQKLLRKKIVEKNKASISRA